MHPDNPCQHDDSVAIACKTWELLRRNEQFRTEAERYVNLWREGGRENRDTAWTLITTLEDAHPFAAHTLRWMVPEPYFSRRLFTRFDGTDEHGQPAKWDLVWHGFAPDMPPEPDVDWMHEHQLSEHEREERRRGLEAAGWKVDDDMPSTRGYPCRLGPQLHWCERDKVDEILEWRDYQASEAGSSVPLYDRAWRKLPMPLQRAFQYLWRDHLADQLNPFTGKADRRPPHVVKFGEHIRREMMQADEVNRLALLLRLQDYSDNYVVFAFPKGKLISQKNITDTLEVWKTEIEAANRILIRNAKLFGTNEEWEYFLHSEGRELKAAHLLICKEKGQEESTASERLHRERTRFEGYVEAIKSQIRQVFPVLKFPD